MKRPLFVVGATMLFALNALSKFNIKTAWVTAVVALVVFVFLMIFKKQRMSGLIPTVALTLAVCSLYSAVYTVNERKIIQPLISGDFPSHSVVGEVVNLPYTDNGRYYCIIRTEEVDGKKITTKIRLTSKEKLDAEPFDRIEGELGFFELGSFSDETSAYYRSKNMYIGGYVSDANSITVKEKNGFHPMYYILKLKSALINAIETNLPDDYGGLLTGFLLGEKSFISSETLNAFSLIGSVHLLAVSGLHVSVWGAFVYSFLKFIGIKRRLRSILLIAFVLVFEALTGFNPPVVRAGTLLIFVCLGNIGKREADSLNSIGLAVTLMLFINPLAANSGSLWLSTFASVGIILIAGPIYNKINFVSFGSKPLEAFKNWILEALSVTFAVTVFTLPLNVLLFDRFSFVVPFANLVLIGIASVAMIISGTAAVIYLIGLKFISYPLFLISSFFARVITDFSVWLSHFKTVTVGTSFLPLRISAFAVIIIAVLLIVLRNREIKLPVKAITYAVAAAFSITVVCGIISEKSVVRVYLADIAEGMSVAVCEDYSVCLLGCGSNDFSSYEICDIMKKEGVMTVDFVLVPSDEPEDRSALPFIEKQYPIDSLSINKKGTAVLSDGATVTSKKGSALYESDNVKILVVFNGEVSFESTDADYIITESGIYSRNGTYKEKDGKTLLLEVKQNGRARVKTSD